MHPNENGYFQAVFETLPAAAIVFDGSLRVAAVNSTAEKLLRVKAADLIGQSCSQALGCSCGGQDCPIRAASRGQGMQGTLRIGGAEDSRAVTVRSSPLPDGRGGFQGVVAAFGRVTDLSHDSHVHPVAESESMRHIVQFARRVAASDAASVLLQGENGTGKDVIAKLLHYTSARAAEPFVAINCAAMPETLLESELFGYEKGAFTDARSQKRGLFEVAGKGTLFLDEVGELPLKLQAKLLRVLEDQTFRRLGGLVDTRLEARVLAATNRSLHDLIKSGEFRKDLYYRLNVIQIEVPPLRDHPEDIVPLADHFLEIYNRKFGRELEGLSGEAVRKLLGHQWPGNVRELKNAIERAVILEESNQIQAESLPPEIDGVEAPPVHPEHDMSLGGHELRLLKWALEKSGGNQTRAAALLGVSRDLMRYRMKKFGLLPPHAHVDEGEAAAVA